MAGGLYDAGAAALTIHGRTASDRYTKAADWGVIARVVDDCRARGGGMAAWFKCRPCPCLRSAPAPPQGVPLAEWLGSLWHSEREPRPLGAQPLPRVLLQGRRFHRL